MYREVLQVFEPRELNGCGLVLICGATSKVTALYGLGIERKEIQVEYVGISNPRLFR
jgi:hypothetical protein